MISEKEMNSVDLVRKSSYYYIVDWYLSAEAVVNIVSASSASGTNDKRAKFSAKTFQNISSTFVNFLQAYNVRGI